ncbi:MAG TPA: hypothetical protein P5330_00980 [Candidatus Competibacteraceae bacterium]|nr:hypothetical protein [Candidatus Competibacteraceae bacterium]
MTPGVEAAVENGDSVILLPQCLAEGVERVGTVAGVDEDERFVFQEWFGLDGVGGNVKRAGNMILLEGGAGADIDQVGRVVAKLGGGFLRRQVAIGLWSLVSRLQGIGQGRQ